MRKPDTLYVLEVQTDDRKEKVTYRGYRLPSGGFLIVSKKIEDLNPPPPSLKSFSVN